MHASLLILAAVAGTASPAAKLSPSDQAAMMKVLCAATLEKEADGWVCRDPEREDFGQPLEQHWVGAWRGRFAQHADEWLVGLHRARNAHGVPGEAHVLRKVKGTWRRTHEFDIGPPLSNCLQFGGMADGLDRLACITLLGPYQGFFTYSVVVHRFGGDEGSEQVLMQKDQGGECFLTPPLPEHQADQADLEPGDANSGAAFTVRLQVQRAKCDANSDEGHGAIAGKGQHVLRFVRFGDDIVPDPSSARIIEAEGWKPEGN